uniref:Uncharacterized protein n=1 Tax=Podoviridae sp. ctRkj24 TaxID=2823559 RepID=A0A8S5LAY7_9CAUD|nr:MAG TPA: hypothetical protein [Podoviridae sp. ctRkj24]
MYRRKILVPVVFEMATESSRAIVPLHLVCHHRTSLCTLTFFCAAQLRQISPHKGFRKRRRDGIAASCNLRRLGIVFPVCVTIDDVLFRKPLRPEQFARREHSHPDIDNPIWLAAHDHKTESVFRRDCMQRLSEGLSLSLPVILNQECCHKSIPIGRIRRHEWLVYCLPAHLFSRLFRVILYQEWRNVVVHDVWLRMLQHKFSKPSRNAPHRIFAERLLAGIDARARDCPVDDLCRCPPRMEDAARHKER